MRDDSVGPARDEPSLEVTHREPRRDQLGDVGGCHAVVLPDLRAVPVRVHVAYMDEEELARAGGGHEREIAGSLSHPLGAFEAIGTRQEDAAMRAWRQHVAARGIGLHDLASVAHRDAGESLLLGLPGTRDSLGGHQGLSDRASR